MNKAWLVRPNPNNIPRITEFLKNNIVAVGWPGIGDLTSESRQQIKSILEGDPYNYKSLELGNAYATIDIIVNQISIGDIILVPNGDDIYFAEITSAYLYDPSKDNNPDGYPHQRRVKWLTGAIPRNNLPMQLRSSLRVHRATADLSKHNKLIEALSQGRTDVEEFVEETSLDDFIEVSYPIRPNVNALLVVPSDITQPEALRLSDFIKTIYFK